MSMSWNTQSAKLITFEERFNSQSLRERILVALSVFAVIYLIWIFAFKSGMDSKKLALDTRLSEAQKNMTNALAQEKVFTQAVVNDPNAEIKYEILQLKAKLKTLDDNLQGLSVGLIPVSNFTSAVEDVLSANKTLALLGMTTLKPKRLNFGENIDGGLSEADDVSNNNLDPQQENKTENQKARDIVKKLSSLDGTNPEASNSSKPLNDPHQVGVFKHAIRVNIEGPYFDVVSYLSALEDLSWTFYWSEIDYKVNEKKGFSPTANVTFEIYTLSTDAGVFGV